MASKSFVFRFADVEVREREFSMTKAGEVLAVEPKAFRVMVILLRNPGKLIPKQELLDAVWGDATVTENSLSRAVALLRKVLGDEARTPRFIETVATVGYRWVGRVEAVEDPTALSTADASGAADAGEAAKDRSRATTVAGVGKSTGRSRWRWVVFAGVGVIAVLAGGFWYLSRPLPPPRITAYTQITHDGRGKTLVGTDGSRLYFNRLSLTNTNATSQVAVGGGESADLDFPIAAPMPWGILLMDISPDGSNALLWTMNLEPRTPQIWVAPVLGGAARRLDDGDDGTFSPDSASVIYSGPGGEIFMIRTDGTAKHKLANVPTGSGAFRWSPDGRVIRFTKDAQLWEMSADATGAHPLLPAWNNSVKACCGRWTPDGKFFVFFSSDNKIWALDERRSIFRWPSSIPIQLTGGPMLWGRPFPGRDGKTIYAEGATQQES